MRMLCSKRKHHSNADSFDGVVRLAGSIFGANARAAGHGLTGLDVAPGANTDVLGSVADYAVIERVFDAYGIEAVIHAGALHKPDITRYSPQAFLDANVRGTLNLLECAIAAGHDRFVFTSTTSLMISQRIRDETDDAAIWLDEASAPIEPRNIYGVTKLAAENLCRLAWLQHKLACVVLRTSRFFPEDDDTHRAISGENMKANEFLYRRLTVSDAARAHLRALQMAPEIGFNIFIISAPTPFKREDCVELKRDARAVIARYFPEANELYHRRGWLLPRSIGRIYEASLAHRMMGFRCETDFRTVLAALSAGQPLPFTHDADYISPAVTAGLISI